MAGGLRCHLLLVSLTQLSSEAEGTPKSQVALLKPMRLLIKLQCKNPSNAQVFENPFTTAVKDSFGCLTLINRLDRLRDKECFRNYLIHLLPGLQTTQEVTEFHNWENRPGSARPTWPAHCHPCATGERPRYRFRIIWHILHHSNPPPNLFIS